MIGQILDAFRQRCPAALTFRRRFEYDFSDRHRIVKLNGRVPQELCSGGVHTRSDHVAFGETPSLNRFLLTMFFDKKLSNMDRVRRAAALDESRLVDAQFDDVANSSVEIHPKYSRYHPVTTFLSMSSLPLTSLTRCNLPMSCVCWC